MDTQSFPTPQDRHARSVGRFLERGNHLGTLRMRPTAIKDLGWFIGFLDLGVIALPREHGRQESGRFARSSGTFQDDVQASFEAQNDVIDHLSLGR